MNEMLTELQGPLMTLATAVISFLGVVVSVYAKKYLSQNTALAVNASYQIAMDAAAGWLKAKMDENAKVAGTKQATVPLSGLVEDAVAYVRESYPDAKKIEPNQITMAADVLSAFGRLTR